MLRIVPHSSAAAAHSYYSEGLQREDYYSEGQEVAGKWFGAAAERLGLSGQVTSDAFAALVENRHPATGERLTARTKAERVVGVDFNFHAPKSLSLLHAIAGDARIAETFRKAVAETMADFEVMAETRVRKGAAQANRFTGNLAWAEFLHLTARPVGGVPDPHLHVHCFVFNATFDGAEDRWKAVKFRNLKAQAPYMEAAFQARLAASIAELGFPVQKTAKGWEIAGVSRELIERFSRRKAQVEELALAKGITDPKARDALGAASRERKKSDVSYADLRKEWESRLSVEEAKFLKGLGKDGGARAENVGVAKEAMNYAMEKLFERNSVVSVKGLVAEACRAGFGRIQPDSVWKEFAGRDMIIRNLGGEDYCTSAEVLAEEIALINFVRSGRGRYAPPAMGSVEDSALKLSDEQESTLQHILQSRDQVIAIQGKAGVGKTTLMTRAVKKLEASGVRVFPFAPSAAASRGTLREVGFTNANTVAHLLHNQDLQREVRGQVIWIDEAGQLGVRDLWQVMRIAGADTRVILTGDTGQHASVARGDAFRLLHEFSGLKVAHLTKIRRQEQREYRGAVKALSVGDLRKAFRQLDDLDAIKEIEDDSERYGMLAADYLAAAKSGTPPLIVSPTHAEGAKVTEAVRRAREGAGELRDARRFTRYHDLQWQEVDRRRADHYHEGLVVQFHQNAKGICRGELFRVCGRNECGEVLATAETGRQIVLPLRDAKRFLVYEERQIEIARGERLRITRNGRTADGRRINSGDVFTVDHFTKRGDIVLTTGGVLEREHGHFRYGYCETSHSSQSKSVRDVFVAQSADSFAASSREQFYVSVSRGKSSVKIYTDDREGLQSAVGNTARRRSAVELAGFSEGRISSFMKGGLNGDEWRDRIRSAESERKEVANIATALVRGEKSKDEPGSFRDFVASRRRALEANCKPGLKGRVPATEKDGVARSTVNRRAQVEDEPAPVRTGRKARAVAFMKNSVAKARSIFAKDGAVPPPRKTPLQSSIESAAKHQVNAKAAKAKVEQAAKHKAPPPPVIRKGK